MGRAVLQLPELAQLDSSTAFRPQGHRDDQYQAESTRQLMETEVRRDFRGYGLWITLPSSGLLTGSFLRTA